MIAIFVLCEFCYVITFKLKLSYDANKWPLSEVNTAMKSLLATVVLICAVSYGRSETSGK